MQSGYEPSGDTEVRVSWSPWTHCESSFGLVLTPHAPGVFAVAEEVSARPDEVSGMAARRLLTVVHIGASDDLGRDLARLFAVGSPVHDRLASGHCYLRYAVLPDLAVRDLVFASLEHWLSAASEAATEVSSGSASAPAPNDAVPQFARWPEGF